MTLATLNDYETLTGAVVAAGDLDRVGALLGWASEAVLAAAHGQQITLATSTDVDLYPSSGVVVLPQRPVVEVTEVATVDASGVATVLVADDDYRWEAGGNRRPALLIRRRNGIDSYWGTTTVRVTYTHGWDIVPGPIVAAVCSMARALAASGGGPAMRQTIVGPFQGAAAEGDLQSAAMTLTASAQRVIDQWCGVDAPTSTPIVAGAQ